VSADLLADGMVARMLGGLSTRGYPVGLEPVGQQVEQAATGTSHSAVSRRFVTATAERLDQLLHRPLGGQRWLVVFLDGFGMGEHLLVGALGVTADGTKIPLGVVEGTTENTAACTPSDAPIDVKWEASSGGGLAALIHLLEHCEDLSSDVALEAADDLLGGLALGDPPCHVVLGRLVPAQPHHHDAVQRGVGLAVAAAVDSLGRLRCQGAWLTMPLEVVRLGVGKVASCPASRCDLTCASSAV